MFYLEKNQLQVTKVDLRLIRSSSFAFREFNIEVLISIISYLEIHVQAQFFIFKGKHKKSYIFKKVNIKFYKPLSLDLATLALYHTSNISKIFLTNGPN